MVVTTTRDLISAATERMRHADVPSPLADAETLLAHVTGRPRATLRLAGEVVPDQEADRFWHLVEQRSARIPLQHLTGRAAFRRLEVNVGPGVFIPRPETELMVDDVLAHLRQVRAGDGPAPDGGPLMVDLCTGSGALALSLALEAPGSHVVAVDVSPEALAWADRSVSEHAQDLAGVGSTVQLVAADATCVADPGHPLAGLRGRAQVVVSNPPYIPEHAVPRQPEVRDHDPALALYGGSAGLDVVRPLVAQAAALLRPGGLLLVEHADVQGEDAEHAGVPGLLRRAEDADGQPVWQDVVDHCDLTGLPRYTSTVRAGAASR